MKTISFFSYKGGAGRSTLAYNVIPILAKHHFQPTAESPMIIVDTDVDSCGMSYLLKAEDKVTDTNCIQHLLGNRFDPRRYDSIEEHPFLSQLIPVGRVFGYDDDNAILLLPAKDNKNIGSDSSSNYADTDSSFGEPLRAFLTICERDFDVPAVIFDSSVGNTATANVTNDAADIIVCCMRPTIQFVNGTRRHFFGWENFEKPFSDKHIIFVPNVIPQNEVVIDNARYPDSAISKIRIDFTTAFGDSILNKYYFDMLNPEEFGIPAVNRFMWREDMLFGKSDLNDNEKIALGRYRKLAGIINDIETEN